MLSSSRNDDRNLHSPRGKGGGKVSKSNFLVDGGYSVSCMRKPYMGHLCKDIRVAVVNTGLPGRVL